MPPKRAAAVRDVDLEPAQAAQLCSVIDETGSLPPITILELLKANVAPCAPGACKSNRKDHPGCFCCLAPAFGSSRKKGLWQKESGLLGGLGPDPEDKKRELPSFPAGLRNLGNTCYVNTALQCLFAIPAFRAALLTASSSPTAASVGADAPSTSQPQQQRQRASRTPSPAPAAAAAVAAAVAAGPSSSSQALWQVDEVAAQLADLFLELQFGPASYADPTAFASCLQLDHAVQQDCQEFFKLLVTKLEGVFAKVPHPGVKDLIQTLFRGSYSYVTTCSVCGRASASSSASFDFYEVQLPVKGLTSLAQALASALECERLDGDNQYHCEYCARKVDATRQMVLRAVPPYLCLQLQRFVFDYQKMDKLKLSDKLAFPLELDMGMVLASVTQDGGNGWVVVGSGGGPVGEYELAAVLIHKGSNAHHGHYVAHVKEQRTGGWWRFDDESVQSMGAAPTGFPGDHGVAATVDKEKGEEKEKEKGKGKKRGRGGGAGGRMGSKRGRGKKAAARAEPVDEYEFVEKDEDEGTLGDGEEEDGGEEGGEGGEQRRGAEEAAEEAGAVALEPAPAGAKVRSANAYMLLYRQKGWHETPAPGVLEELPEAARSRVQGIMQQWSERMEGYKRQRAEILERVEARRAAVRHILSIAPPPADESGPDTSRWISAAWLDEWVNGEGAVPSISNQTLLCEHGGLDPGRVREMKRVSGEAWRELQAAHGGGPELSTSDFCASCLHESLQRRVIAEQVWLKCEKCGLAASACTCRCCGAVAAKQADDMRREIMAILSRADDEGGEGGGGKGQGGKGGRGGTAKGGRGGRGGGAKGKGAGVHRGASGRKGFVVEDDDSEIEEECSWSKDEGSGRGSEGEEVVETTGRGGRAAAGAKRRRGGAAAAGDNGGVAHGNGAAASNGHAGSEQQEKAYYVSKTWLQGWMRRAGGSISLAASPTSAITCPHGGLLPQATSLASSKRLVVPERVWVFLKTLWDREARVTAEKKERAEREKAERDEAEAVAAAADAAEKKTKDGKTADSGDGDVMITGEVSGTEVEEIEAKRKPGREGKEKEKKEEQDVVVVERGATTAAAAGPSAAGTPGGSASRPPPPGRTAEFPVASSRECPVCQAEMQGAAAGADKRRQKLDAELRALSDLAGTTWCAPTPIEPSALYYVVPRTWLRQWRMYVNHASKRGAVTAAAAAAVAASASAAPAAAGAAGAAGGGAAAAAAAAGPPRPRPLPLAMTELLCPCHPEDPLLRYPLPAVSCRRNRYYTEGEDPSELTLVSERDWLSLSAFYGLPEGADQQQQQQQQQRGEEAACSISPDHLPPVVFTGIQAFLMLPGEVDTGVAAAAAAGTRGGGDAGGRAGGGGGRVNTRGGGGDVATSDREARPRQRAALARVAARMQPAIGEEDDGDVGVMDEAGDAAAPAGIENGSHHAGGGGSATGAAPAEQPAMVPFLYTAPTFCTEHMQRVAREAREAALTYADAEVMVEVVKAEDLATAWTTKAGGGEGRKSRRARKGRTPLTVSSWHTLMELKLRVYQALDVHPGNAELHLRSGRLQGDDLTLAQLEVLPDEEIRVVDLQVTDGSDLSFLEGTGVKPKGRRAAETGFKNTALLSGAGTTAGAGGTSAAAAVANGREGGDGAHEGGKGEAGGREVKEGAEGREGRDRGQGLQVG